MKRRELLTALAIAPFLPHAAAFAQTSGGAHMGHGAKKAALAITATFAPDGSLWIAGLNADNRLFVQRSTNDGAAWSTPQIIDTGKDVIAADGENRPKLVFGPNNWAVISYTQPLSKPYTGEIRMVRSADGGKTFSAPFTVHQDRQLITHRFESIAFDASGALHTFWVDKRDLEALASKGDKSYVGAAIYRNVSLDGGKTFGTDIKLADHSCECCRIALAPTPSGGLAVLWRHVFGADVRDHAFAIVEKGGKNASAVTRASFDEWRIEACPHHGPGLTPSVAGGYHAVWFGIRGDDAAVRYSRLDKSGKPVGDVRALPDVSAEHAHIHSIGKDVAIVWRAFNGEHMTFAAWVSNDDGKTFRKRELGHTDADTDHPFLIQRERNLFAVWRTAKEIRVERVLG